MTASSRRRRRRPGRQWPWRRQPRPAGGRPGPQIGLAGLPPELVERARWEYLHRRTGGMIGSLLRLIRGAAIQAVLDGTEEITRATLDSIGVDIASRTADPGPRRPGALRGDT